MMTTTENSTSIFTRAAAAGIDLEAERELFERQYGPKDNFAWRTPDGDYKVAALQSAWEIWLTSVLAHCGSATPAANEQEHNDLARKAAYWWDTLLKCARLLDVPVEDSIPQGVLEGVKQLLAKESQSPKDSAQVAEKLAYIAGQIQQYGQELVAAALRLSAEKHEKRAGDILRGIESMLLELTTAVLEQPLKEVGSLAGRTRFENWVRAEALKDEDVSDPEEYVVLVLQRCTDGDYATTWVQAGWNAWQAAIAQLSQDSEAEREAFIRLCEVLGIPATAGAYLEAQRFVAQASAAPVELGQDAKAVGEEPAKVEDLAALVRQLVHSLRKAKPDSDLATRAVGYLKRKGLAGNPLR
jgi:hypothetical protein